MNPGWASAALGEVARIASGATPKTSVPGYWDGDVSWATPKDLSSRNGKILSETDRKITAEGLASCSSEVLPVNSVLLSSRAPIGLVAINARPMATNQGFKSLVPGPRLDASYLYWWLRCNRTVLESLGNGATFKEISKSVVQRIEVPLPPLDEQRRIAAVLDHVDALRAKCVDAIDQWDCLPGALLAGIVPDAPGGVRLGQVVRSIVSGKNVVASDGEAGHPIFRVLPAGAVTFGKFQSSGRKAVPASYVPPRHHFVRDGNLLFGRANTSELVGAVAIADEVPRGTLLPDKIWRIEEDDSVIDRVYLRYAMAAPTFRQYVRRSASGTSSSMKNISKRKLEEIPVPLPPLPVQQEFALKVRRAEVARKAAESHLFEFEGLFASLQARAFAGELDVSKVVLR